MGFGFPIFQQWDDELGWRPVPGVEGPYSEEGRAYIRINQAGYRDRDHALKKPPRSLRIAVLGDSYTEAFQVDLDRTYWSVAERKLNTCRPAGIDSIEVINFGVYAYGTAQELLTLRSRAWAYEPDIVILLFTTGNDVRDNSRQLRQDPRRPYFVDQGGQLVLDNSFREKNPLRDPLKRLYYDAVARSRVMQLVHRARFLILNDSSSPAAQQAALGGGGRIDLTYTEPQTQEAREAWRITEELVTMMNGDVTGRGASFVMVVGTNPVEVHPDLAVRQRLATEFGAADLTYSVRRLTALGRREAFDVIPLLPSFEARVARDGKPLHGFDGSGTGHWNEAGHALAGEVVADRLCARLPDLRRR